MGWLAGEGLGQGRFRFAVKFLLAGVCYSGIVVTKSNSTRKHRACLSANNVYL